MLQIQEHLHDRLGELDAEMVIPKRKVRVCIVTGMLLGDIALQQKTSYRRLMGLREPWLACWIICAKQATKLLSLVPTTDWYIPDSCITLLPHPHSLLYPIFGCCLPKTSYAGFSVSGTPGLPLFFYPELKCNFLSLSTLSRILSFNPDVLHFVDPILLGPQVILAAKLWLPHVPRVSSFHTNIALYAKHFGYPYLSPAIWSLQRYLHGQCDAIMCPSPSTRLGLLEHGFPDRIKIWHRGVDTGLFAPEKRSKEVRQMWGAEGKVVLLYVGRVSWEKNLRCLARAYLEIWKTRKDVHLVVTGDGPARTELEGMFSDVKASVTFTGYLEGPPSRL